jgi:hypothetical protein
MSIRRGGSFSIEDNEPRRRCEAGNDKTLVATQRPPRPLRLVREQASMGIQRSRLRTPASGGSLRRTARVTSGGATPYWTGPSRRSSPAERPQEIARLDAMEISPRSASCPVRQDASAILHGTKNNLPFACRALSPIGPPYLRRIDPVTLHLRRQISRDFHACANFDNDGSVPAHDLNSLSFSPRRPFWPTKTLTSTLRAPRHLL